MQKRPPLADYLAQAASRPWSWGSDDCCLFAADWVRALTGIDGAAPWRGRYLTELGCLRLLKRDGGLEAVVRRGAELAGLSEGAPTVGAIGVLAVQTRRGPGLVAGICTGRRWAMRTLTGVLVEPAEPLAVWRV